MLSVRNQIFLLLSMLLIKDLESASKISVRIPSYVQAGETADLTCSYYLDSNALYSVKWYKGRHEFYRYMPGELPPVKTFPIKGMKINMTASDHVRVVLEDVTAGLTGQYLCEVTMTPTYFALAEAANMTVIEFPSRGPQIQVDRKEYHAGDMVAASCTVPTSSPTPALAWYINDEPVSDVYISRLQDFSSTEGNQTRLDIRFPIVQPQFKVGKIQLKCLATIAGLYWETTELTLHEEHPKLSQVLQDEEVGVSSVVSSDGNIHSPHTFQVLSAVALFLLLAPFK